MQSMLDSAWQLAEVRGLIYYSTGMMNIKSMWSRVLAETGLVGFAFFLIFLVVSAVTAVQLSRSNRLINKTIGWMGISMLLAFFVEGFSVDSFALPYLWFTLGLVAANWWWSRTETKDSLTTQ